MVKMASVKRGRVRGSRTQQLFRLLTQIRRGDLPPVYVHVWVSSSRVREERGYVAGAVYHGGIAGIAGTTNRRSPNLLLVIDRLFIQMNADYRGGFSMLRQLAGAMNKLLPGARTPVLSVVLLQDLLSFLPSSFSQ